MKKKYKNMYLNEIQDEEMKEEINALFKQVKESSELFLDDVERIKRPHYRVLQIISEVKRNEKKVGEVIQPIQEASKNIKTFMEGMKESE